LEDVRHFEFVMPMRWGDMDAMGHINNTIYFRYLEQARIAWFEAVFGPPSAASQGPILAHVSCDFVKPLVYPGDVRILQDITRLGRSSVEMELALLRDDDLTTVYARARSVVVWMDYAKQQSAPWPEAVRGLLEPAAASKA